MKHGVRSSTFPNSRRTLQYFYHNPCAAVRVGIEVDRQRARTKKILVVRGENRSLFALVECRDANLRKATKRKRLIFCRAV